MMTRLALIPAVVMLAACEGGFAMPDFRGEAAAVPTEKERFVSAIEANGCIINVDTIAPILVQASISDEQLEALSRELAAEGALTEIDAENVKLTSATCV